MTLAVVSALGLAAALLQVGAVPAFFLDGAAAPLLPVALLAAWAAAREPAQTWPVVLVTAATLGAISQERVGWFLIALLPTVAVAALAGGGGARRSLATAPLTAAAGAALYLLVLALAAGRTSALPDSTGAHLATVLWTAAAAALLALALAPLRPRPHGLFQ